MARSNPAYVHDGDLQDLGFGHNYHEKPPSTISAESFSKQPIQNGTTKDTAPAMSVSKPNKALRDKWGKDIEFLLSCIALSVGLGNVWRFPFTALENGGGAFVIPYLIVLLLVGRPIYYLEMLIGQFSSRGAIEVYDAAPAMRGIGYGQIYSTFIVMTYYASIMGITVRYLIASFGDPLPWGECRDSWNATCIDSSLAVNFAENTTEKKISSAELFFE